MANERLTVSLVIGNQPLALAVKRGEIPSDLVNFDVVEIDPIYTSFKPMVRELRFDVCEMAIVTSLMARDRGIELTLIPAVMLGRQQRPLFIHNSARGELTPDELAGKRVGVRLFVDNRVLDTRHSRRRLRGVVQGYQLGHF